MNGFLHHPEMPPGVSIIKEPLGKGSALIGFSFICQRTVTSTIKILRESPMARFAHPSSRRLPT